MVSFILIDATQSMCKLVKAIDDADVVIVIE
jgi:hypothetical protein